MNERETTYRLTIDFTGYTKAEMMKLASMVQRNSIEIIDPVGGMKHIERITTSAPAVTIVNGKDLHLIAYIPELNVFTDKIKFSKCMTCGTILVNHAGSTSCCGSLAGELYSEEVAALGIDPLLTANRGRKKILTVNKKITVTGRGIVLSCTGISPDECPYRNTIVQYDGRNYLVKSVESSIESGKTSSEFGLVVKDIGPISEMNKTTES